MVMVHMHLKTSARAVSSQMRVLTADGTVPTLTNITSLADSATKAPFVFDKDRAPLAAKNTLKKWQAEVLGMIKNVG